MTQDSDRFEHPLDYLAAQMEAVDDHYARTDKSASPLFAGMTAGFGVGALVAEATARRMFDRRDLGGYVAGLAARGAALSLGFSAVLSANGLRESYRADRETEAIDAHFAA